MIGSKIEPIRISCVKQRIIFESIEIMIRALFFECPEPSDASLPSNLDLQKKILDLCNDYNKCIRLLNYKGTYLSYVPLLCLYSPYHSLICVSLVHFFNIQQPTSMNQESAIRNSNWIAFAQNTLNCSEVKKSRTIYTSGGEGI